MKKKMLAAVLAAAAALQLMSVTAYADQWQGTEGAWWYQHDDGTWAVGWRYINGSWYYFDSNGYMKTGWVYDNGKWYYMYATGEMHKGWLVLDEKTYYMFDDGSMAANTFFTDGSYYYLADPDGSVVKDTIRSGIKYDERGCAMQRDSSGTWTYIGSVEDRISMAKETMMTKYINHEYGSQREFEEDVYKNLSGSMTTDEIEDFIYETEQLFEESFEVSYDRYRE